MKYNLYIQFLDSSNIHYLCGIYPSFKTYKCHFTDFYSDKQMLKCSLSSIRDLYNITINNPYYDRCKHHVIIKPYISKI